MKIRTITTGIWLDSINDIGKVAQAAEFNKKAKDSLEKAGYEVQTIRVTTNSWEDYLKDLSEEEVIAEVKKMEQVCIDNENSEISIGYANSPKSISMIPQINNGTTMTCCCARIGDKTEGINIENVKASAKIVKQIAEQTDRGEGNFRFCAWANCKPGIPFYPASFHGDKESSFAIGLECGDFAMKAFSKSNNLKEAEDNLKEIFENELDKIEKLAQKISREFKIDYKGIDCSLNPSLEKSGSIAFAYEKLGFGKFGCPGTLAISAMITKVLKNLSVKTTGYSGLMLPVCEDSGLAERANERTYNITNLLLYSSVCGCGLDTVPIPGDVTVEKIEAIFLDMVSLAIKLNKPLSARLFPVPGKKAGEMTIFNSPYLVNCRILDV